MPYRPFHPFLFGVLLMVAGCQQRDPYYRTDVWQPTGANAANLAAMVADPDDLILGRGTARTHAQPSATAVNRIWTDQPRSLSPSGSGSSGSGNNGASSGGGGSGEGGGMAGSSVGSSGG